MKWNKLSVRCTVETQEAVSNILIENGAEGLQIEDEPTQEMVSLDTYFAEDFDLIPLVARIKEQIANLAEFGLDPGDFQVGTEQLDDSSWADEWKKYYHTTRISRYLAIAPSWEDEGSFDAQTTLIKLDPGKSFGTGTHPTTILALHGLESVLSGKHESMIDVGTGSGVLSIAARLLGAGHIEAYDVEDESLKAASENFALNYCFADINLKKNDLLNDVNGQYDLITANILAEIIVPLIPQAFEHLKTDGKLILSGIIADKLPLIQETLHQHGFEVLETMNIKDWYGIVAVKLQNS
ncbi:ribosomal protein L11 methyltransferase [Ligilactobacillus salitolerans]|uniref:Ribosomal protein L11 methyltransferase n=1 Tax=Ligilactobacillus salitolerans TaxID=1808352 RepID=A0A401ITY5_9LACO|nr:50S ribosomal protein L11 methyltransferase [Ligilactobacillus salitolerans]GBG95001.1 ribosomal protein L11 methyltransferase [Ligilactobacillus salitolerans]